jgi:hypothetical protein
MVSENLDQPDQHRNTKTTVIAKQTEVVAPDTVNPPEFLPETRRIALPSKLTPMLLDPASRNRRTVPA